MELNKYQTVITEELKETLPREVYENLIEYTSTIKFIKNLIAPKHIRGFAKDRPISELYDDNRIDVDITNPHILEDMDYFRQPAIFFGKNGKYTNIPPNSNPKSEYAEHWKSELVKWKHGIVRPSDGEWIPGELYFYWNYSPIWLVQTIATSGKGERSQGERVKKFAKPWLGDYLYFHYTARAKRLGKHGKVLKTRGIGFPGPLSEPILTPEGFKTYGDIKPGDYLIDLKGNPTKVIQKHEQDLRVLYELTLMDGRKVKCAEGHLWSVYDKSKKFKDKLNTYSIEHMIDKKLNWFNKNGNKLYKFYIPDLLEPVKYSEKELSIPPYVLGCLLGDGTLTTSSIKIASDDNEIIEEIQKQLGNDYSLNKDKSNNNYIINQKDQWFHKGPYKQNQIKEKIKKLNLNVNCFNKFIPDVYKLSSPKQRLELVKGLMDIDGSINTQGSIEFSNSNLNLINDLSEVLRSLGIQCTIGLGRPPQTRVIRNIECVVKQEYRLHIRTNQNIFKLSRKSNRVKEKSLFKNSAIINIKKLDYLEECVCFTVENNEHLYLTTDFIPTHNSFKNASESPRNMYVFPGSGNPNFHLASDKGFLSGDKGIWGKVLDTLDWIAEHTPLPRMRTIDATKEMNIQLGYKDEYGSRKGLLSSVFGISLKDNPDKARGIRGPLIHYEEDGLFPNLEKAWNVNRKAVEDGGVSFGFMLAGGTGGVEGASFAGSEKLFYKPAAYNILGIANVFDKGSNGENECGFFWGAYLNRNECYDEECGEPDVIKSLIEILLDRHEVKYNSSDARAITQKKAEEPITPQEAIMRTEGTVFPVADIKDYLESIGPKKESFLAEHYIGELINNHNGDIEWKPLSDKYPLRAYDSSDTDRTGCLEIFEMPKKNANGEIVRGRYIFGIDPIDADTGTSLFSIIGMDTFTDRIVCEYTGRPRLANDAYEIALRTIKFYNGEANYESNLKGLFSYFDARNCLHYLCDVPQILRDMDMVKATNLYGNKAKGTHANKEINKWGRLLQAQYMLTRYNEDSEDDITLKLHHVRSIPYLEECVAWNSDGNFDRVSAAGMLFLLREDRVKRTSSMKTNQNNKIKKMSEDNFFNRNWKASNNNIF